MATVSEKENGIEEAEKSRGEKKEAVREKRGMGQIGDWLGLA